MQPTPEQAIDKYIAYRNFIKTEEDALEDRLKPYKAAMVKLSGFLAQFLLDTGQNSAKTDAGTAYTSKLLRVNIEDRDKFIEFINATGLFDFFTNAVSKPAVQMYIDEHDGNPPPGVAISYTNELRVKKG